MRILHVVGSLGERTGGAAIACLELCVSLAAQGHEVEIFTTTRDIPANWQLDNAGACTIKGVTVWFHRAFGARSYWISPSLVRSLIKRCASFDIVEIHSLYRFHLPVTSWVCRWNKQPYIVKPHGSLDPFLFRHHRWRKLPHEVLLDGPAYAHAAAIHYGAEEEQLLAESTAFMQNVLRERRASPLAIVVREGTDVTRQFTAIEIQAARKRLVLRHPELRDKRVVLFLGRLNFKKGLDILVDAFAKVKEAIPNAHLLIVGPDLDGYAQQVQGWLTNAGLTEAATFTGMLVGAEKSAAFSLGEVFVLPSYTENFGIAIIEAMLERCPVVISNKVNIWREIVAHAAGLVTNCDPTETANAVLEIMNNKALSSTLALSGEALVREHFAWPAVASDMTAAYEQLLSGTQNKRRAPL